MPIARRISLPAPLPRISGITPAQKAIEVIRIGRSRIRQAWITASSIVSPRSSSSFANSTIRIAFLHARPTSTTSATWVKMFRSPGCMNGGKCESQTPNSAASTHIGTISTIAIGRLQLSYCAASTRTTSSTAISITAASIGSLMRRAGQGDVARQPVLVGQLGPLVAHAARQRLLEQRLDLALGLAATRSPGSAAPLMSADGIAVVARHARRAEGRLDRHQRAERHHLAGRVARLQRGDRLRVGAERRVGLHDDLVGLAEAW